MDQKEARKYLGTNHHFNPSMNPGTPPKQGWFDKKPTQPIKIQRQMSLNSDGTASPTASPSMSSPSAFSYPSMQDADKMKKPRIFKSFDFSG